MRAQSENVTTNANLPHNLSVLGQASWVAATPHAPTLHFAFWAIFGPRLTHFTIQHKE